MAARLVVKTASGPHMGRGYARRPLRYSTTWSGSATTYDCRVSLSIFHPLLSLLATTLLQACHKVGQHRANWEGEAASLSWIFDEEGMAVVDGPNIDPHPCLRALLVATWHQEI